MKMWPRVGRVDRDRADRAVVRNGRAPGTSAQWSPPSVELVEAEAGLGVARAALFTGAGVDRAATLVGRVDQQRADRGRRDVAADRGPVRVRVERVVRPPDSAARSRDVERAVLAALVGAAWIDGERRHAARPLRRPVERLGGERGHVVRERAELLPGAAVLRARGREPSRRRWTPRGSGRCRCPRTDTPGRRKPARPDRALRQGRRPSRRGCPRARASARPRCVP